MTRKIREEDVRLILESGEHIDAASLLEANVPDAVKKFKAVDKAIRDLLREVQAVFPDAEYYTGAGGFNLLLGPSHSGNEAFPNQEFVALQGKARISDGDW